MIKISELNKILQMDGNTDITFGADAMFAQAIQKSTQLQQSARFLIPYADYASKDMVQKYTTAGAAVLASTINKIDVTQVPGYYLIHTGLLNSMIMVGYDTALNKDGQPKMETALYTQSEKLLTLLRNAGAFENDADADKQMATLYKTRIKSAYEKGALAYVRLDLVQTLGDTVALKMVLPRDFRTDLGDTFVMFPYCVFPHLTASLIKFNNELPVKTFSEGGKKITDIKALQLSQEEPDGSIKTRKLTFIPDEVSSTYRRKSVAVYNKKNVDLTEMTEEIDSLLKVKLGKGGRGWDCLKLSAYAFNLESSLYAQADTRIRFERLIGVTRIGLRDIDPSQYFVDYDMVRNLFRTSVNNWKLANFDKFAKYVDTSSCANLDERRERVNAQANSLDDTKLYDLMRANPELFSESRSGAVKSLADRMDDMVNLLPKSVKRLAAYTLPDDPDARVAEVISLLKSGVCRMEVMSSKGAQRIYTGTNNQGLLAHIYRGKLFDYESPANKIKLLREYAEKHANTANLNRVFEDAVYKADLSGTVLLQNLPTNATLTDINALLDATAEELKRKAPASNPFLVSFRRINADAKDNFYGSTDTRNIISFEYAAYKK